MHHKTGVEMEALMGATAAALTIYDMCKALSHDIVIESDAAAPQDRRQARLSAHQTRKKIMNVPRLHGLVLAGGRSSRMRRDKAAIEFRSGETQLDAAMKLLEGRVARAYRLGARGSEGRPRARAVRRTSSIAATSKAPSPASAPRSPIYPDVAWLVLACDLPFLDAQTLDTLLLARDPELRRHRVRLQPRRLARAAVRHLRAEPREPRSLAQIAAGRNCPRKFLINAHTQLLEQPNPRALDNVNTVEEYERAMTAFNESPANVSAMPDRTIRVQYYALLREQAGRSDETLTTGARDARELYAELSRDIRSRCQPEMLRVAINAEFGEWSQPLKAGDAVVFIPPVAGG